MTLMKFAPLLFLVFLGCASGEVISETNNSLGEIRSAIQMVVGEPRTRGAGDRVFESGYFSKKKGDTKFDPEKSKQRRYVRVNILGDRRPYDIRVQVIIEERVGVHYEEAGLDEEFGKQVAREINEHLTKGRGGRNVIDDFRAF